MTGMKVQRRQGVVLLSGGLDSATTAAWAQAEDYTLTAISVDYGQRHRPELDAAERVAGALGIEDHRVVRMDLSVFHGSALIDRGIEVPKDKDPSAPGVPVTYVPARNTVMLSLALGVAESLGAFDLFIGANVMDYSGYPDCRPEYLRAFEAMAQLATEAGTSGRGRFAVHAPLLELSKAEIIQMGSKLGLDYTLTISCYDPNPAGEACGRCDSCQLRRRGFAEAGLRDPTVYQS